MVIHISPLTKVESLKPLYEGPLIGPLLNEGLLIGLARYERELVLVWYRLKGISYS